MVQKLKSIVVTLGAISIALLPMLALTTVPAMAAATNGVDLGSNLCNGADFSTTSSGGCSNTSGSNASFQKLLTNTVNIFTVVVGVVAVIMIIVGGLRYITSGGDTGRVGAAKTTIIYALIGLVVVALAQLVVHFVLSQSQQITG